MKLSKRSSFLRCEELEDRTNPAFITVSVGIGLSPNAAIGPVDSGGNDCPPPPPTGGTSAGSGTGSGSGSTGTGSTGTGSSGGGTIIIL